MEALESAFRATAVRWWTSHKKQIPTWEVCQKLLRLRFSDQLATAHSKFDGKTCPQDHLSNCYEAWKYIPHDEWVHRFVHTLGPLAKNWYEEAELRRDTVSWDCLVHSFVNTFSTNDVCPALDAAIRVIHTKVFNDQEMTETHPDWATQEAFAVECYNFTVEEEENPRSLAIPETEGYCDVHGPTVEVPEVTQPLKTRTVNIGSEAQPKFATIGDYWDNEMVSKVTQLLHEYQDLFPTKFSEMKGILGDIGVMKIPLNPDSNPVKQHPYRLNPKYKEKVKLELEKMLAAGIIEPVEESDVDTERGGESVCRQFYNFSVYQG